MPVVVIGVVARTGSAVAVALGGTAAVPLFLARDEIDLVTPGLPAQPYHEAAGLAADAAESLIDRVERVAEDAAAAGLRALLGKVPAAAPDAVAVVTKPVSVPDDVAGVLRSHAWMHAAEGVLYRRAFLAAASACGWPAHAVEQSALPAAEQILAGLGQAAGRPWRRTEKDAARAALTLLPLRPASK
jgi:hypothetical protein